MSMSSTRVLKAKNSGGMPQLVCGGYSFDQVGEDLKLLKISVCGGVEILKVSGPSAAW